ncbi:DNA breaking-rejoining enzyme [Ramaria rubella]|nr:DNA breaking-rejoining enzyme [Ramaria rubella]
MEEATHKFPHHIVTHRRIILTRAVKPSTLVNYSAGLICFTKFCDDYCVPEEQRMPASKDLLSLFITTQGAGSVAHGAMKNWIAGLELWHHVNSAPWHGTALLDRVLDGSSRLAPESSSRAKCDPVTLQHIQALRDNLDLTNNFNTAVFAVACIALWCCCRLGELLIDLDFDPKEHISCSTPIRRTVTSAGLPHTAFHVPSTKTTGSHGTDIFVSDSTCHCSGVFALEHHLKSNANIPKNAPLFAFETADGGWAPMHRKWFMDRCNTIWSKCDLASRMGHDFRIGGTTHLLLLGIDPWVVMALGRWSGKSFLKYWRKCEEVLPLMLGFH